MLIYAAISTSGHAFGSGHKYPRAQAVYRQKYLQGRAKRSIHDINFMSKGDKVVKDSDIKIRTQKKAEGRFKNYKEV